ncbi:nipped-B protein [Tieghemostelium lacteum]|uniref:Sister chromatid cohesion protein n=1 Tax=Tieghemostelium lacteum TaxID=361077 RepID=A0A151ZH98_TIELA|nr:nipped-B protein [Tieghemostelium lacteum]|eukprot:KYQ93352.1 nipped-B protein [Tieghemostelium lacteum]
MNQENAFTIPNVWLTNLPQISDPINELPIPVFRNDASVYMVDNSSFATTVSMLADAENENTNKHKQMESKNLLQTINNMITNTNVSNIKVRSDIMLPPNEPSLLLKNIYKHVPAIKSNTRKVLSELDNITDNNGSGNHEKEETTETIPKFKFEKLSGRKKTSAKAKEGKENQIGAVVEQPQPEIQNAGVGKKEKKKVIVNAEKQEEQVIMRVIDKLSNIINHFLESAKEDRNHHEFNLEFFENLRKEIQTCSKMGLLKELPLEKYAQVVQYLIKYSKESQSTSLSYNINDEQYHKNFKQVEFSLECCLLSFTILTMPEIDNNLCQLMEDELVDLLAPLKYQVFENILGHLDPSFRVYRKPQDTLPVTTTKQAQKKSNLKKKVDNESQEEDDEEEEDKEEEKENEEEDEDDEDFEDEEEEDNPYVKKRKTNSNATKKKGSTNGKESSKKKTSSVDTQKFNLLSNKVSEIFERIAQLLQAIVIPLDTFASILLDITTPTLFLEGINFIQFSSIQIIRNVFLKYPKERDNIIDELLSNCYKIIPGKNRKIIRPYKIYGDKSIQNISALLIQLVQNAAHAPQLNFKDTDENNSQSLREAQRHTKTIILFFIEKCSEKLEDTEYDYKILFDSFIQDLLTVLNYPEWSGSAMILHLLSATIVHIISKNTKSDNFRLTAVDILGNIVSKLKHEIVISSNEVSSLLLPSLEKQKDQQKVKCYCKKFGIESFNIKCESCTDTYHDQCAPDFSKSTQNLLTEQWNCISCRIKKQIRNYISTITTAKKVALSDTIVNKKSTTKKPTPKTAKGKRAPRRKVIEEEEEKQVEDVDMDSMSTIDASLNPDNVVISDKEVYQQLILNYLESKSKTEKSIHASKQFLISHWVELSTDPTGSENRWTRQYFLSQWEKSESHSMGGQYICSDEEMKKIYRKWMAKDNSSIFGMTNSLLYHLLNILVDTSIKCRAKAMKSFIGLVEVDPSILAEEYVHNAIKNRFVDESISVREHTVDLIGKYILIKPELTFKYIDLICDRISDKGISVRKRVVKTLNEICTSQPNHPKLPEICRILVSRINDDDSIRDLILKTFQDLWFSDSPLVTKNKEEDQNTRDMETLKVKQIIEVAKQLDQQDNWLIELINKMLNESKNRSSRSKKPDTVNQTCQRICSNLIEMLVSLDEKKSKSNNLQILYEYIGVFKTLYVFCKVSPQYLIPYVKVLHPYLKIQPNQILSHEEAVVFTHIMHILERVLPLIDNQDPKFLASIEQDLCTLIQRQGSAIVHASIKCLCTIIQQCSANYSLAEELLLKAFQVLQTCQSRSKTDIVRNLYTSGLLIRYFPYENRLHFVSINQFKPDQVISTIVPLMIQLYNYVKDKDVVAKSLEAVGNIIISTPTILNKDYIKDLLYKSFQPTSDPGVKETVLNIFYDLLEKEMRSIAKSNNSSDQSNNKSETTTAKEKKKPEKRKKSSDSEDESSEYSDENNSNFTEKKNPNAPGLVVSMSVDQNSESLVSAVQKYFTFMVKLMMDPDRQVRLAALQTIYPIINQGILNPLDCVPSLVVLLTDSDQKIAEKALSTLTFVNQKYTSSIFKSISESIQMTYKFHFSTPSTSSPNTTSTNSTSPAITYNNQINKGFGKFYLLFKTSKVSRTNFINMILQPFDSLREFKYRELTYFKFIFEILASLPYGNMDEVILVINTIDRLISLNANFIKSEISQQLSAKLKLQNQKAISKKLRRHLTTGLVLTMILQLKKFILDTYQITKEKMKLYLDETKDADKLSTTYTESLSFSDANYPFSAIPNKENLKLNEQTQKQIYMDFKQILKNDDQDEFSIKLNGGKKETAKKRKQNALKEPKPAVPKKKAASTKSRKKKHKISSDEDYEE